MSERGRFDGVTIAFHWLIVALFVPLLASVFLLGSSLRLDAATLIDIHRGTGAAILALTLLRLIWRKTVARLPPFPATMSRLHRLAVTGSEGVLYALLFAQPLSGLAMTVARGRAFTLLFWQVPALMTRDKGLAALCHGVHETIAYALLALIGMHATAALLHHFVLRDDVLSAMLPLARPRQHCTAATTAPPRAPSQAPAKLATSR